MIEYYANKEVREVLEKHYSKTQIKTLVKQSSIKVGEWSGKMFVKVGQDLFVICKYGDDGDTWTPARQAELFWEYHNQLIPKVIEFKKWSN